MALFAMTQANASVSSYTIDDAQVESVFASSTEMPFSLTSDVVNSFSPNENNAQLKEKNGILAIVLTILLGGLGVHRFYLGTKTLTGIGYILTCGGIGGLVPLVDFVVLIIGVIKGDIDKFVDNPKFFMWL